MLRWLLRILLALVAVVVALVLFVVLSLRADLPPPQARLDPRLTHHGGSGSRLSGLWRHPQCGP